MSDTHDDQASANFRGDPAISPRESEVLGRRFKSFETRKFNGLLALSALLGSVVVCLAIDFVVWLIEGAPAYIGPRDIWPTLIVFATFAGVILLTRLPNFSRLWILSIVVATLGSGIAVSIRFHRDAAASSPVQVATFVIESIDLRHGARGLSISWAKMRPEARLRDSKGREWTLSGRQGLLSKLRDQDCITLRLRGPQDGYRFIEGTPTLVERPYIDSVNGERPSSRCFAP